MSKISEKVTEFCRQNCISYNRLLTIAESLIIKNRISHVFFDCFKWMDDSDIEGLQSLLLDDIIKDIEESADEDFNDDDVRIAIRRTLFEKLGI